MKRIFFGLIVIVTMICFFNLVPSTAADKVESIGEERRGIDDDIRAPNAPRASGQNYSKESYTAVAPSPTESYDKSATKIFSIGQTVYLICREYYATPGNYTTYYFITDVVGTVVGVFTSSFTISSPGHYWGEKAVSFNAAGSFVYFTATLGSGWIISQQFSLGVE